MGASMKKVLSAAALSVLLATPVMAADMRMPVKAPPAPVIAAFSWTGFYLGAHGGYGWGDSATREYDFGPVPNSPGFLVNQTYDMKGAMAGGVLGYNW